MTAPIIHELMTTIYVTGDEIFPIEEFTRNDLVRRFLQDAPCLEGREEAVMVTSEPLVTLPQAQFYSARALCPTPDTCSLPRKADR